MRIKKFKSFSYFAMLIMILCLIPSGAFASENQPKFAPVLNITEENFTDVKAEILDSISEQIAELQNFYNNVSEASSASGLNEVLSSRRYANECMGPHGMHMRYGEMHGLSGFVIIENVTEENFTDVQTQIVDSLGNKIDVLKAKQARLTEAGADDRAKKLGERISDLQNLSAEIGGASTSAELQDVVLTYMKTQTVESYKKEIEFLEAKVSESEKTSDENMSNKLNRRITELTALIEKTNEAKSLTGLSEIMSSSKGISGKNFGMNCEDHPMKHRGHRDRGNGRYDCSFYYH